MTPQHLLGSLADRLGVLMQRTDKPTGGVHMLLVGDWLQLSPVSGLPAFANPMSGKRNDSVDVACAQQGKQVYDAVNCVVRLDQNMRHRADPAFGQLLERVRHGNYTAADLKYINDHATGATFDNDQPTTSQIFMPTLTSSNLVRAAHNMKCIHSFAQHFLDIPLFRFDAEVRAGPRSTMTAADRRSLALLTDDVTNRLAIHLYLAVGMPVITKNTHTHLKLANGALGEVIGVQHAADNIQTRTVDPDTGLVYMVCTQLPDFVFVRLRGVDHELVPGFGVGIVPVTFVNAKGSQIKVKRRLQSGAMTQRTFTVDIKQVPVVQAFPLTAEKTQGLTLDDLNLDNFRPAGRLSPARSMLYVALSRCRTLSSIHLLQPLTSQNVN